ncbi:MAG: hypothetical protein AAF799_37980 [Myxococcota bacterium]
MRRLLLAWMPLVAVSSAGCVGGSAPAPEKVPAQSSAPNAAVTPADSAAAGPADGAPSGPEAAKEAEAQARLEADAEYVPPELTEEDLALIAADPKDLTPEMRRKRAYARRRQIMQNPDSPTARALRDLSAAHQSGNLDVAPKGNGVWFHTPGSKPKGGIPPAGWRPSDDEPKESKEEASTPPSPPAATPSP